MTEVVEKLKDVAVVQGGLLVRMPSTSEGYTSTGCFPVHVDITSAEWSRSVVWWRQATKLAPSLWVDWSGDFRKKVAAEVAKVGAKRVKVRDPARDYRAAPSTVNETEEQDNAWFWFRAVREVGVTAAHNAAETVSALKKFVWLYRRGAFEESELREYGFQPAFIALVQETIDAFFAVVSFVNPPAAGGGGGGGGTVASEAARGKQLLFSPAWDDLKVTEQNGLMAQGVTRAMYETNPPGYFAGQQREQVVLQRLAAQMYRRYTKKRVDRTMFVYGRTLGKVALYRPTLNVVLMMEVVALSSTGLRFRKPPTEQWIKYIVTRNVPLRTMDTYLALVQQKDNARMMKAETLFQSLKTLLVTFKQHWMERHTRSAEVLQSYTKAQHLKPSIQKYYETLQRLAKQYDPTRDFHLYGFYPVRQLASQASTYVQALFTTTTTTT